MKPLPARRLPVLWQGASPHSFAGFTGDPNAYGAMLTDKIITKADCSGGRPELKAENMILSFSEGVNIRYFEAGAKRPEKHQLLLGFTDGSAVVCTVQMYGGLECFPEGMNDNFYYNVAKEKPSPLSAEFDKAYFASSLTEGTQKLSAKAFLATDQRIPGLSNGVSKDILWNAKVHPKRKINTLSDDEIETLFDAVKLTLNVMTEKGGRTTEKDLFGNPGGYATVMCKKNQGMPCPVCGGSIKRMAYLGGNVYICDACQQV